LEDWIKIKLTTPFNSLINCLELEELEELNLHQEEPNLPQEPLLE
jgi:hypothetical protein